MLTMQIHLQYGQDGLTAELPTENATIIRPRFVEGLPDEQAAFREAVRRPNGARPLAEAVGAHESVAIVIADGTRPCPRRGCCRGFWRSWRMCRRGMSLLLWARERTAPIRRRSLRGSWARRCAGGCG